MNTYAKLMLVMASLITTPFNAHAASHAAAPSAAMESAAPMSEGEVRKVDRDAKKITIKHGELKNLDMPSMTMVFQVKNPSVLDQVKTGDKISFVAEKVGGQFTVTEIEVKK